MCFDTDVHILCGISHFLIRYIFKITIKEFEFTEQCLSPYNISTIQTAQILSRTFQSKLTLIK